MVKIATAIGIVRVSEVGGREGESFASPTLQRERIEQRCAADGMRLLEVIEELDVSGGTPLAQRHGLRRAIEMVEAGDAQVIVAAYFDRLARSLTVKQELVSRVEAAGGRVLALDVGDITHGTAGQWLSSTLLAAVHEHQRRSIEERTRPAIEAAVARGVLPYANIIPGLRRQADGTLEPDPDTAGIVADAYRLRADGASYREVREFLADHGIVRSYAGVVRLLRSRLVLGEIHFGRLVNLHAHDPIVDRDVWQRAQRVSVPRGRPARSERLLARLGVLRCASCDSRMIVGMSRQWPYYRCPPTGDCDHRAAISAPMVERFVADRVRERLRGQQGRASAARGAAQAAAAAERAQADLDAAIRVFAGLEDERTAIERLAELRQARDDAQQEADRLRGQSAALVVDVDDWDLFTLDAQRALIQATVQRATVAPGRGTDRVTIEFFGE